MQTEASLGISLLLRACDNQRWSEINPKQASSPHKISGAQPASERVSRSDFAALVGSPDLSWRVFAFDRATGSPVCCREPTEFIRLMGAFT